VNELSLFSGAGGGLLGTKLLGWRNVGYVEWDSYCQRVLAQRIDDGYLDPAPIFTDVREFVKSGAAAEYRGFADVVTAGFPCQPFSVAGKRAGADDERNMWPATIDCIRAVRPRFAFLENVPGLLVSGYFGRILGDLAESGYDCRWRILSAAEMGAPHRRQRLWIVAYSERQRRNSRQVHTGNQSQALSAGQADSSITGGQDVADTEGNAERARLRTNEQVGERRRRSGDSGSEVSDTKESRLQGSDAEGPAQTGGRIVQRSECDWWSTEPDVGRVAHGVASRVDRLKALGNGQVPAVVAAVWRLLSLPE